MAQTNGTTFSRIEDGEWDPKNPNVYYFLTTESNKDPLATAVNPANSFSRDGGALWKMTFADAKDPFKGATVEMLLNGTEPIYLNKPDNLTVDENGYIILQEDPGNNDHVARLVAYRIADGKTAVLAKFDDQYFTKAGSKFITVDEETSGAINVNKFLKTSGDNKSHFFFNAQVHTKLSLARPELVAGLAADAVTALDNKAIEGGQYYNLVVDWTKVSFS
jgi:secreted PhoX family phosphatase